ncbi:asparagine synthase (glutamine-hydrolyzing) [Chryseomicrobium sp. FSL W7-1435]|uniref:asparagine synthase (glutamine-hydrolyzing) n=1 Tax=Chryseomicrobium sp. FSL W7-1435 TaxID=2921704 RepID=UPI00315A2519
MCGIVGVVQYDEPFDLQVLSLMTDTLHERGPDATGFWHDENCAFGHKRLIVIDPEGGQQPFIWEQYRLVYNGELYNTDEVRDRLKQLGHQFQSYSDTEVLIHAFAEWQEDCVHHLNGIFAFAVWNEQQQTLFMARDRLGVKPLFYSVGPDYLLFASEVKALLAHPAVKRKVNREGLAALLVFGPGRFPGRDAFCEIFELRPGHRAFYEKRRGFMQQRYWQLPSAQHTDSPEQTIQKVRALTEKAIHRQLVSDVPVGTFLSGGIDSSIITAIAAKTSSPLSTFSLEFEDNSQYFQQSTFQPDEDAPYINAMVEAYGLDHKTVTLDAQNLFDALRESVKARDFPGMGDIDSSLLHFCRVVKPDATVILSGECADELFAGYPWLQQEDQVPDFQWIRDLSQRLDALHPAIREKLPVELLYESAKSSLLHEVYNREETTASSNHKGTSYLTMQHFMQNLLERKDRMSMRSGLEVRVPFADHELWEYVWNIPLSLKRLGGKEKGLLRAAFHDVLPDAVLHRKKNPFPKTFHPFYTSLVQSELAAIVASKGWITTLFRPAFFDELFKASTHGRVPWFGQLMQTPQLMAYLIQLEYWATEYNVELSID